MPPDAAGQSAVPPRPFSFSISRVCSGVAISRPSSARRLADLVGVAPGQLTAAQVQVVFQADAHVPAMQDGGRDEVHLAAAGSEGAQVVVIAEQSAAASRSSSDIRVLPPVVTLITAPVSASAGRKSA